MVYDIKEGPCLIIIEMGSVVSGDYIIYESEAPDLSDGVSTHQGHSLALCYRMTHCDLLVSTIEVRV